jgi:hypothetical protein
MVRSLSEVAQRRFNRPKQPGIGGDGESQWRGLRIACVFYTADSEQSTPGRGFVNRRLFMSFGTKV